MKKKIIGIVCGCMMMLLMSISVFAATSYFSIYLPIKSGDTELAPVKKETTKDFFWVVIDTIGSGTNKVCVWAEGELGANLSSPTKQAGIGGHGIDYTTVPSVGKKVVLNFDNPVYLNYTVTVTGGWTPN